MKSRFLALCFLSMLAAPSLLAQADTALRDSLVSYASKHRHNLMDAVVIKGDTIPLMVLDEVLLVDKPTFNSRQARHRYNILKRKVIKVYPYAVEAGNKLDSLRLVLDEDDGWFNFDRKRKIKSFQDYLRNKYEPVVRQLTHSEGQILSKLIHRETGLTSYELIQEYRSGFNAFWWNMVANINKISLKTPYRPAENEEDKLIETILKVAFAEKRLQEREPITSLDQLAPQDSTEMPTDSAAGK
ncbi:MAG: DUF4294 domain-containing protein [Schleiferiaceae bacterium]|jgi:hypothetical protein|nr:DUF4294 domain-containing protein [Schleiferiaceae bacterium]